MIKNNKGVTLVELLIVIVILGIIAAISIPAVGNIVDNANQDALLADATNIRSSTQLCITSGDCDEGEIYGSDFINNYIDNVDGEYLVSISGTGVITVAINDGEYQYVGTTDGATRDDINAASWTTTGWNTVNTAATPAVAIADVAGDDPF